MRSGLDSAYAPNPAQIDQAHKDGHTVWAFYVGGAGALNVWTAEETRTLEEAGFLPLPIWVPSEELAEDPTEAARAAIEACRERECSGMVCLDTEFNMRGPKMYPWQQAFSLEIKRNGWLCTTYTGGFDGNSGQGQLGTAEWQPHPGIQGEPPAGTAWQTGSGNLDGLDVDTDLFDDGFPLAGWINAPSTAPAPAPAGPVDRGPLNAPIVAVVNGAGGYWLVGADGGVFAFGQVPAFAGLAGEKLAAPIVGASGTFDGLGLHLVGADGGVYSYGSAVYSGSLPGLGYSPAR